MCPPISAAIRFGTASCAGVPGVNIVPGVCQPYTLGAHSGFATLTCGVGSTLSFYSSAGCAGAPAVVVNGGAPATCTPIIMGGVTVGAFTASCPAPSATPTPTPTPSPATQAFSYYPTSSSCSGSAVSVCVCARKGGE